MRTGWVCDTAYQILNCVIYVLNERDQNRTIDLFIGHQFVNSEEIENRLRETNLFHRVIPYMPLLEERSIKKAAGVVSPRYRIRNMLKNREDMQYIPKSYDRVYMAVLTYFSKSLVFLTDPSEVYYFDDGLGSYFGNISAFKGKTGFIYKLLGYDIKKLNPKALYVNNTTLCQSRMDCPKYPLPALKKDDSYEMDLLSGIFNYKRDDYYAKYRFLYLTQPNDDGVEKVEETDEKIIELLAEYGKDVLLRPHPRQKQVNTGGLKEDSRRDMWELVCADQIRDDHVLIGVFSTAQIIPKLLYNKEPYIIFLYKLYPMLVKPQNQNGILNLTETIKSCYGKPEKVFLPDTLDALKACLRRIAED